MVLLLRVRWLSGARNSFGSRLVHECVQMQGPAALGVRHYTTLLGAEQIDVDWTAICKYRVLN